jgi:putative hemolysin
VFWEIAILGLLIFANGCFALAEIAIITARKSRLKQAAEKGDERAREALALANSPNDFLASVQVGLTLVSVLSGAYGGMTLGERLGEWLNAVYPVLHPYGHALGVAVVVSLITYFSLVVGELIPKRIALARPEQLACRVAAPMRLLSKLTSPVVAFLGWSTDAGLGLLRQKAHEETPVSEEEVRGLIEQGLGTGVFHQVERDMLEGVFNLDQLTAGRLMTPSSRIVWLNIDDASETNWRKVVASGHSQFPVYHGNRDNCVGLVSVKALWANASLLGSADLRSVMVKPLVVPESMQALVLVEAFRKGGMHFAMVADEFGSIRGLITLHDVLESIVGLLPDKAQRSRPSARRREDGAWVIDASMEVSEVKSLLRLRRLPGEESGAFISLAGFLIDQLEHIPVEGERVVSAGHVFEVLEASRQRIDRVLATKVG